MLATVFKAYGSTWSFGVTGAIAADVRPWGSRSAGGPQATGGNDR